MIDEAPIVKDTRRVRQAISEKFDNDPDKYIDYLLSQKTGADTKRKLNGFMPPEASEDRYAVYIHGSEL
jgi:hypothetical protein